MNPPRIESVPPGGNGRLGDDAVKLAADAGLVLDDWQAEVLRKSMRVKDGEWAAFEVGLNVPRQNGKNVVVAARELAGLFLLGEKLIVHTAHEQATADEHYRKLEDLCRGDVSLNQRVKQYRYANGTQRIETYEGGRIVFKTRTRTSGRGLSGDLVVLDEAMILAMASIASLYPVMRARRFETKHGPQVWYAGSAVDQEMHEHGLHWSRVRERARMCDPSLAYFEWSADCENVNELTESMAEDLEQRAKATPALGVRIDPRHVEREYRSLDLRTFGVELLGVGDYPSPDGVAESIIPLGVWDELADPVDGTLERVLALAYDVSPDRRASIVAAGIRADGLYGVAVLENRSGTSWLPATLSSLADEHGLVSVRGDGYGPAASMAEAIEADGVKVEPVTAGELAQACGRLLDVVAEATMRHSGSGELRAAVKGARTRPLGDSWAWSRKNSTVDISPLVAATLALWEAVESPAGDPVIF